MAGGREFQCLGARQDGEGFVGQNEDLIINALGDRELLESTGVKCCQDLVWVRSQAADWRYHLHTILSSTIFGWGLDYVH